ncbi:GFA family protein [Rhodospirillaceae bacterium KN72]|uniref:GFA family protein n=1 Tax=Pacificispira spongiicola TaxID=2729598 RepID=A0A7Y0E0A4_9PROT|nr:GFA family protein [Pacificispira spongiicola]NMM44831.1 GFA family protein [Pacificispira spongiicola]
MSVKAGEILKGRCTCGAVQFRLEGPPMVVHACHCTWCQRETGTAFAHNAMIEMERVFLEQGEPETIDTPSASGKGQKVVRCPHCKVAVWSHYPTLGTHAAFVRVGTLEQPARLPPDAHIFTESKVPWLTLPEGIPAFPIYYDRESFLSAEVLARQTAVWQKANG